MKRKNIYEYLRDGIKYAWHDFYKHYVEYEIDKIMGKYPTLHSRSTMEKVRIMFWIDMNIKKLTVQDVVNRCTFVPDPSFQSMMVSYFEGGKKNPRKPFYLCGFSLKKYEKS